MKIKVELHQNGDKHSWLIRRGKRAIALGRAHTTERRARNELAGLVQALRKDDWLVYRTVA